MASGSFPRTKNYPADAADHLAEAATSVTDLKILGLAGSGPGDFKLYGVIEPTPKLEAGSKGVGIA